MKHIRYQSTAIALSLSLVLVFLSSICVPSAGADTLEGIEKHYDQTGPNDVTSTPVTGFKIFHPTHLTGKHPIITWGNGTGAPVALYTGFLKHLASWGFVVVASESVMTITGKDMIAGIDYLLAQNKEPGSKFYKMLDIENIGSTGHSQGGGGAINAAVSDRRIKCCAPLAPAPGLTGFLHIPMFIVAGENDHIASVRWITHSCFQRAAGPTIFAIASKTIHASFTFSGGKTRGYVTAWFMYQLQNDSFAQKAFEEGGELFENPNWEVQTKNYP